MERDGKSLYDYSNLVITIIEAQNVDFDFSMVKIMIKDQTYPTPSAEGRFPQFNSQTKFTGTGIKETISIMLSSADDESETLTGSQIVSELADQKIHDKWISVKSNNKPKCETKVHLQFQYTFSRSKICAEANENWKQHVNTLRLKNGKNVEDLNQMYRQFDFLETIAQKPNYFADIRPVDKIGPDVI